jgi:hypothetical protein
MDEQINQTKPNKKPWIADEIKVVCQNKKNLNLLSSSSTDSELKNNYKSYCKGLTKAITKAKQNLV